MSIDDMISRDTRVDRLARLCGWSRRETRACLEDIWAVCYDRIVPYLPADDIEVTALRDAIAPPAHPDGFVAALIAVGLARPAAAPDRFFTKKDGSKVPWKDQNWRERLYLAGSSERIGYQLTQSESGSKGGKRSAEVRQAKAKQRLSDPSTTIEGCTNPSASASASASVPEEKSGTSQLEILKAKVDAVTGDIGKARNRVAARAHPDQQRVIDSFHQRYKARYGQKPTWEKREIGMLGSLLKKHSADVLEQRMDFMFAGKARWPQGPYSLQTFVAHIDRWVEEPKQQTEIRHIPEM